MPSTVKIFLENRDLYSRITVFEKRDILINKKCNILCSLKNGDTLNSCKAMSGVLVVQ